MIRTFLLETYAIVGHHLTIAYIRGNVGPRRDSSGGATLHTLITASLLSAAGSAGGGVPPVYYGCAWTLLKKRVGQLAGSFFFVPDVEHTQYIQPYRKNWHLQAASPVFSSSQGDDSLWRF